MTQSESIAVSSRGPRPEVWIVIVLLVAGSGCAVRVGRADIGLAVRAPLDRNLARGTYHATLLFDLRIGGPESGLSIGPSWRVVGEPVRQTSPRPDPGAACPSALERLTWIYQSLGWGALAPALPGGVPVGEGPVGFVAAESLGLEIDASALRQGVAVLYRRHASVWADPFESAQYRLEFSSCMPERLEFQAK